MRVLHALGACASPLGICYASQEYLGELAGGIDKADVSRGRKAAYTNSSSSDFYCQKESPSKVDTSAATDIRSFMRRMLPYPQNMKLNLSLEQGQEDGRESIQNVGGFKGGDTGCLEAQRKPPEGEERAPKACSTQPASSNTLRKSS